MYLSFEEWAAMPETPQRLARRAALTAERKREEAELAALQRRTAAAYAAAEAAETEEAGMAIIAEYSRQLLVEWRARHAT